MKNNDFLLHLSSFFKRLVFGVRKMSRKESKIRSKKFRHLIESYIIGFSRDMMLTNKRLGK